MEVIFCLLFHFIDFDTILVMELISTYHQKSSTIIISLQHTDVFVQVSEIFILVPSLLGLKGNLEMTLASRLSTQVKDNSLKSTDFRIFLYSMLSKRIVSFRHRNLYNQLIIYKLKCLNGIQSFCVSLFQANLGNMDKKSEQWKMIGGNMALVQVWSCFSI